MHDAAQITSEDADDVVAVLNDLGLDERQQQCVLHIFNKSDLLRDNDQRLWLGKKYNGGVFTSATARTGIDDLLQAIDRYLAKDSVQAVVEIKPEDGAARAWLYANAHVHNSRYDDGGCETLTISISHADHARFHARWPHLG